MSNIKEQQVATLSAEGFVTGKLNLDSTKESGEFVHESGTKYPCKVNPSLVDSPNLKNNQLYKVYPYSKKETGLNFYVQEEVADEPGDVFDFVAKIQSIGEGEFTVAVWSTENQRYFNTKISGYLQAKREQLWNLECELDGSELMLIDGKKLAEKWSLPANWKGSASDQRNPIRSAN